MRSRRHHMHLDNHPEFPTSLTHTMNQTIDETVLLLPKATQNIEDTDFTEQSRAYSDEAKRGLVVLSYLLKGDLTDAFNLIESRRVYRVNCATQQSSKASPILFAELHQMKKKTVNYIANCELWWCSCPAFSISLYSGETRDSSEPCRRTSASTLPEYRFGGRFDREKVTCPHLVAAWLVVNGVFSTTQDVELSSSDFARVVYYHDSVVNGE